MVQTTVIEDLEKIAISHEAVNHKYLIHLKSGGWPNSQIALAYFASQYQYYSDWFPKYLNSTISKLSNEVHRNQLMDNLMEESGHLNESERQALEDLGIEFQWVNGIAHPVLFDRFKSAICANQSWPMNSAVENWRSRFLSYLQNCSEAEAVGAIGLGTESIVKHFYKHIIEAITSQTSLSLEQYVFFPLHTEVDDEHGKTLLNIAAEISKNSEQNLTLLSNGMLMALELRAEFWNQLLKETNQIIQACTN